MLRICITPGEPAGIGPDVTLQALQGDFAVEYVVVANHDMLQARAKLLGISTDIVEFNPEKFQPSSKGKFSIVDVATSTTVVPGKLDPRNAEYVLKTLDKAHELCIAGKADALITGPVQKSILKQYNSVFRGHTEYLAELCDVQDVVMSFYHPDMVMGLATTHYGIHEIPRLITAERLEFCIKAMQSAAKKYFDLKNPTIGVLGLNPHAGEDGQLGREEVDIIEPVLEKLRASGIDLVGPMPADTAFTKDKLKTIDMYLGMYHDQGLIPIKTLYFNEIVNVTLGLPYIRTSVDHGTAINLSGTGRASADSLRCVLERTNEFVARANSDC